MKIYITKDSVDSSRAMLNGKTVHEWDEAKIKQEQNLFDLGIAKEFDEKTDIIGPLNREAKLEGIIAAQKAEIEKLSAGMSEDNTDEMEALAELAKTFEKTLVLRDEEIETLKLLVEEAISLPRGTSPKGFEKYKG